MKEYMDTPEYRRISSAYRAEQARLLVRNLLPLVSFVLLLTAVFLFLRKRMSLPEIAELVHIAVPSPFLEILLCVLLIGGAAAYGSLWGTVRRISRKLRAIAEGRCDICTERIREIEEETYENGYDDRGRRKHGFRKIIDTGGHKAVPVEKYSLGYKPGRDVYILVYEDIGETDAILKGKD